jgi:NAD(P)-dependent dehydrogenase (short-subunit alcohol dehydrogenase family)
VDLFGLSGKTAVVIGGTGTLGGAIADALSGAGAHIVITGRNAEQGVAAVTRLKAAGGSAEYVAADATVKSDLEALVAHLRASQRHCDVLVNAAGINSPTPFLEITDEEWDRIFNINLRSVRLACQVFGKDMQERQTRGSIINIASLSAITPLSRVYTYSASKAAVLNLTLNLAREWAKVGIRVNAMSPGREHHAAHPHEPLRRPRRVGRGHPAGSLEQGRIVSDWSEPRRRWRVYGDDDLSRR